MRRGDEFGGLFLGSESNRCTCEKLVLADVRLGTRKSFGLGGWNIP